MADNALSLAREQYRQLDKLGRAGVHMRIRHTLRYDSNLGDDSVFIKAVSDEVNGKPLPDEESYDEK